MAIVPATVMQAQSDIVALHERSENSMTFALHAAQISQVNRQIGTVYGHCATIMGYIPSDGTHKDQEVAREVVRHIRDKLGTMKIKIGRILASMQIQHMAMFTTGAAVWDICTNETNKNLPKFMVRQMVTSAENLEDIQKDLTKTLAAVQELAELGQGVCGEKGQMQSLDRMINEAVSKAGGGSEAVKTALDRLERAKKSHAESRAGCEKVGQELALLMGKQANEACKHAVFESIATKAKTDAASLNAAAEEARRRSIETSQEAANAADKRWHTKRACSSSVTTENTAEQARARADKFRALALRSVGDCQTAEEKMKKAAAELGAVKEKMAYYDREIERASRQFVELEKDCSTKCRQLRDVEEEIRDLEQKHRMSLSCIADFRTAMQLLPEKFSNSGQQEQYVLSYWEGTVKESIRTSKLFMTQLEAAKEEELPASHISQVLIPVLKKMHRDAQSGAAKSQAVQDAIKADDNRSLPALAQGSAALGPGGSIALEDALEEPAAKRQRGDGQDMVQIPDDDEPLF